MSNPDDLPYMRLALQLAKKAAGRGEVPVGAIIVRDGKVIAKGMNKRESRKNALAHAEILAINKACRRLKNWRLDECDLYVTLEPCPMCMGAAVNARIRRVIYGAACENKDMNHEVQMIGGILGEECSGILRDFFRERRKADDGET
ncbi:MAG: nucleoside deaminase [Clostridiales bacterium]|jgi:tRNA(adenine34) deaminase|nr:nucleoside deaminase [Clostridiales bacterium]